MGFFDRIFGPAQSTRPNPRPQSTSRPCPRCNGTGYIRAYRHIEAGRCFLCAETRARARPAHPPAPLPPAETHTATGSKGLKLEFRVTRETVYVSVLEYDGQAFPDGKVVVHLDGAQWAAGVAKVVMVSGVHPMNHAARTGRSVFSGDVLSRAVFAYLKENHRRA